MSEEPIPHHNSDVDSWGGHPDRSYFTFVIISVLFGFLGLDHFYLRSFGTGTQKMFVNMLTLGMWYWWDVVQILSDGEKIRKDGLNSPLDWIRGIGRGVFRKPVVEGENDATYVAKKSYLIYAFLAIFFGWLGADKFYMGEIWQGLAKLLSCFNIFLFLLGWLWVAWDSFHAFFLTESILQSGISAPLPYSILFSDTTPGSVFKVTELSSQQKGKSGVFNIFDYFLKWFHIPVPKFPVREVYREIVAPLMTPPLVGALKSIGKPATPQITAPQAPLMPTQAEIHTKVMNTAKQGRGVVASIAEPVAVVAKGVENAIEKVHQKGGNISGDGPGPVIAGALTAVVLAGGLKGFYDIISKQYG